MKYFVTSDTHSFFNEMLEAIHSKGFEENNSDHKLVICGDVFDRGDQSIEIYKYLKGLGDQFIYIKGNHEDLLEDCIRYFRLGYVPAFHHWSNGTVETLTNLAGYDYKTFSFRDSIAMNRVTTKGEEVLEWINSKSIDYLVIGDIILVHGWIPYGYDTVKDLANASSGEWKEARWTNGMDAWRMGIGIYDCTIVCGHWHSSYGNYTFHHIVSAEFPDKASDELKRAFQPFVAPGIIAIDSCCAYSGFLNCIVLEVEE